MVFEYSERFFNTKSAKKIIPIILKYIQPASVLDVGCGIGTWLNVFHNDFKIEDVYGIEGFHISQNQFQIENRRIRKHDLKQKFELKRRFDIVLCLEVAEHLPEETSDNLVESLCLHSDNVLFSAALPGQGGQNHINEQWPEYWEKKFSSKGYVKYDIIRPDIWEDKDIEIWYRQNIYFFSRNFNYETNPSSDFTPIIHPEFWLKKVTKIEELQSENDGFEKGSAGIKRSFKALITAILNKIKK